MERVGVEAVRIMVVEDEFLIRMTLAEALGDEGFEVIEAESGDDALPLLQADRGIRLLLTDIQLPGGLDGCTLARKARETVPDLPVIFMTGRPDPSVRETATDIFIAKPYTLDEICGAARKLLTGNPASVP